MTEESVARDTRFGTYRLVGLPAVDFDDFHKRILPARLSDGVNDRVAWDVEGRAPIAVSLSDGRAYSYVCGPGGVEVQSGVSSQARTVLELVDQESWIDYLYEFRTRYGLLYSGAVRFVKGDFDTWDDWEPAIRCMYSGRSIYDPDSLELRDRRGEPLDLNKAFELGDDRDEMSHFLRATGFLVVRRAFEEGYVGDLRAELARVRAQAKEGELHSWWSTNASGERFPYRLTYLSDKSDLIGGLYQNPTVQSLVALSGEEVVPVPDRIEGILAVLKEAGMREDSSGFANLPYHSDCGFGACDVTCPCVLVGVQLDAANSQSSQLHVMAGSWGKACHNRPEDITSERYPLVAVEAEPGDATVHFGCGLHAGPSPTGEVPRRTIYVQHYHPRALQLIGPYQGYNQIMPGYGEGEIPNIVEMQDRADHAS